MDANILQRIVETKCAELAAARLSRPLELVRDAAKSAPAARNFWSAVTQGGRVNLIAEIKRKSPSAGLIRADFDPVQIARIYESAGAAALSVLTDRTYFGGELSFIADVRAAVALPVLRKDFVIDAYQIYEGRAAGADAVLLIAAILTVAQIEELAAVATGLGMTVLVEVHDEEELGALRHIAARGVLMGINNRDLSSQTTDVNTTARLANRLDPGAKFVAESGLRTRTDVDAMRAAGACAVLIGETFMRAEDIGAKVRELM